MEYFQQLFWGGSSDTPQFSCDVDPETGRVLETDEIRRNGLIALRAKMEQHKNDDSNGKVRYPREDDQFLLAFLRARKYKVKDAFMLINNFASFWYNPKHADVINGLCAERVRPTYELGIFELMMDVRDKYGNFCTALNMGKIDVHHPDYTPQKVLGLLLYFMLRVFEEDDLQLQGFSYVETLEEFSFSKAMSMSMVIQSTDWKEVNALGVDTFPMRIRDIYILHEPVFLDWFMALVKPFMKAKLFKRMHMFGDDLEKLNEFVPVEKLPSAFGGARSFPQSQFLDEMEQKEREIGVIGGFVFPLSVDDPTGEARKTARANETEVS